MTEIKSNDEAKVCSYTMQKSIAKEGEYIRQQPPIIPQNAKKSACKSVHLTQTEGSEAAYDRHTISSTGTRIRDALTL